MPLIPNEEITKKVFGDKPADDKPSEGNDDGGAEIKDVAQVFNSKGPVIPDKLPPAASKDELEARAAELNRQ